MGNNHPRIRKIVSALLFTVILGTLISSSSHVLMLKRSKTKMKRFFDEQQNFDVLFTGLSHMQVGVFPMELYGEYGLTAFNLGQAGETIPFAYWILRMALEYTTPKLVVIETRRMDIEKKKLGDYVFPVWDYFPSDLLKLQAAVDLERTFDLTASRWLETVKYHSRWEELSEEDFNLTYYWIDNGATHYARSELDVVASPAEYPEIADDDAIAPTSLALKYLKKTIRLCQERGIEVLLTELPFPATEEEQRYANGVQKIADKYGVRYLNYHHNRDVVNMKTDLSNETHLNDSGARKISYDIGSFIKENYELPDRRGEPGYESWEEQYDEYRAFKNDRISRRKKFAVCLMLLHDRHINTYIRIREGSLPERWERTLNLMKKICAGGQHLEQFDDAVDSGAMYTAYIDNENGTVTEKTGGGEFTADVFGKTERLDSPEGDAAIADTRYGVELRIFDAISGEEIAHFYY
ncbi:MAG: hypothetical protein Q4G47_04500 [Lachnospiraceae bacterium]|nr:hypothetical protein [Lachnospiraceae bacterium]